MPNLNRFQSVFPCLMQRAWRDHVCNLLREIFQNKLSSNLIDHVCLSQERPDIDISTPEPLIPVEKRKKGNGKSEPDKDFLVISLSERDRIYVFEGIKEKKYSLLDSKGKEVGCFIRKLAQKDLPRTKNKGCQANLPDTDLSETDPPETVQI